MVFRSCTCLKGGGSSWRTISFGLIPVTDETFRLEGLRQDTGFSCLWPFFQVCRVPTHPIEKRIGQTMDRLARIWVFILGSQVFFIDNDDLKNRLLSSILSPLWVKY